MRLSNSAAIITALSIVSCLIAYVTKGAIPDQLSLLATTSLGGYLGISTPHKPTTN